VGCASRRCAPGARSRSYTVGAAVIHKFAVAYQADEAVLVEELIAQFGQRVRGVEARTRHLDA
jgi:hypothetical protein